MRTRVKTISGRMLCSLVVIRRCFRNRSPRWCSSDRSRTSGFVYYVSVAGVTGVKEADAATVAPHVALTDVPAGVLPAPPLPAI